MKSPASRVEVSDLENSSHFCCVRYILVNFPNYIVQIGEQINRFLLTTAKNYKNNQFTFFTKISIRKIRIFSGYGSITLVGHRYLEFLVLEVVLKGTALRNYNITAVAYLHFKF